MPSTVVHVALGLLCGAGILGNRFTRRAAVIVALGTAFPDLDVFASLVVESTHRAALHNLIVPLLLALAIRSERGKTWLRTRFGPDAVAVAWTALFGYVVAGVGLDTFTPLGVNLLYPLIDQFVAVDGVVGVSTADGFYQTFIDLSTDSASTTNGTTANGSTSVDVGQRGSTQEVHVSSGVDPEAGAESADTERVFPVVFRGWHVSILLAGMLGTFGGLRRADERGSSTDER